MLRLSKMNDYAVVVLGLMSGRPGRRMAAGEIAEGSGVPLATVSQVLKKLGHAGLVTASRGARGGYVLARPAAEVSVADIVAAMEGPVALTACVDGAEGNCGVETLCPIRGGWDKVNAAIHSALDAVTLADMLGPTFGPVPDDRGPQGRSHSRNPELRTEA